MQLATHTHSSLPLQAVVGCKGMPCPIQEVTLDWRQEAGGTKHGNAGHMQLANFIFHFPISNFRFGSISEVLKAKFVRASIICHKNWSNKRINDAICMSRLMPLTPAPCHLPVPQLHPRLLVACPFFIIYPWVTTYACSTEGGKGGAVVARGRRVGWGRGSLQWQAVTICHLQYLFIHNFVQFSLA